MPRNRKLFINNTAVFVTSRIVEGLPLVPTHCLNEIIWGILARGQRLYPVKICHFVFMANHFHILFVVHNPEDISHFTGFLKAEITHAVNRLLGRRKKSIWDKGYDSPIVLTEEDVLRYIEYIYTNPTRPGLVDTIDQYPGVSSWNMFQHPDRSRECKYISRNAIPTLPYASLSINEQKRLTNTLLSDKTRGTQEQFLLDPWAWLHCFDYAPGLELITVLQTQIFKSIRDKEEHYKSLREEKRSSSVGPTTLRRQSMLKEHTPTKHSRRMICLCSDLELRWRFIEHFRELCKAAAKVYSSWKRGELQFRMPPGLLSPPMPTLASTLLRPG